MEKNSKKIGISRNTANNLIYAVAIFYTIMNVVALIFKALSGTQDMESLISLIGHAGGFAGGVWLCFYIPKRGRGPMQNGNNGKKSKIIKTKTIRQSYNDRRCISHHPDRLACFQ